jgi:tetratricopeptide (TPR) repeat protein
MQILERLKTLLENPFFKSLADFIKMFKSSKSFYSVFYFLAAFTVQQAVAWKYGSALSAWFNSQGNEWYWQLGAFLTEYGSIELVGLGVVLLVILAIVEVNKDNKTAEPNQGNSIRINGDNSGIAAIGDNNRFEQKIDTMIVHTHRHDWWTPIMVVALTALLYALPPIKTVDPVSQQIEQYKNEIATLQQKRVSNLPLAEKIKIDNDIKQLKAKIEEVEEYRTLLKTLSLKLAKEAEKIHQYQGIDAALDYLQGSKAQTQQKELDRRMKEFAQKFRVEAKLLIIKKRYGDAQKAYKNMIRYDRSYESLYEYARYLKRQNNYNEATVVYEEILRLPKSELSQENQALTLKELATIYHKQNHLNKALEVYQKALKIREVLLNNETLLADIYNNIALVYQKQKHYDKALQNYHEALALEESLANSKPTYEVAKTRNNLGVLYSKKDNDKKALNNYNDALSITKKLQESNASNSDYQELFATTLNNLGNLFQKQKKYSDANQSFDKALKIYQKLAKNNPSRYSEGLAMSYNNFGQLYFDLNKTLKAYEVFKSANKIYQALAQNDPYAYNFELANTFVSLAYYHKITKQMVEAKKNYSEALAIYKELAQSTPNLYEFDYAIMIVKGVYLYNIDKEKLKIAKGILLKYKNHKETQQYLDAIEEIGK